jgi:hydrogenase nickel incorporation protein HypA/HybF
MHEMSLCEAMRAVIEQQARAHAVEKITRGRVEIGRFAAVETRALHFAFDVVMRGSVAEGAELVTLVLPGRALCRDCMNEVEIEAHFESCTACGSDKLMPVGGDEMRIKDLEVA